jgi:hypothetical protein
MLDDDLVLGNRVAAGSLEPSRVDVVEGGDEKRAAQDEYGSCDQGPGAAIRR